MLLDATQSQLLVIDIQERLLPVMNEPEPMIANSSRLMAGARLADVPVTVSEQYPRGLGPTIPEIAENASAEEILAKVHFSCAGDAGLSKRLNVAGRKQLVLCGIEAHVCVLQSALGFLAQGYDVFVVADAITSRVPESVRLAEARLRAAGVCLVNVEMVLFEWTGQADSKVFREMRKLIQ